MNKEKNKLQLAWEVPPCPLCPSNPPRQPAACPQARKAIPPPYPLPPHINNLDVSKNSTNRTLSLHAGFPSRGLWSRASFKEMKSFWKHLTLCQMVTGEAEKKGQEKCASLESCLRGKIRNEPGWGRGDSQKCCPLLSLPGKQVHQPVRTNNKQLRSQTLTQLEIRKQVNSERFLPNLDT